MNQDPLPNGLTLGALQAFLLVAEKQGYAAASDGDPGRAANLKNQVARLANAFEVPLTQADGRAIRLTARGKELQRVSAEILALIKGFREACSEERQLVRVGGGQSVLDMTFIPSWSRIHDALPRVRFQFESLQTKSTLLRLQEQRIDFGVVRRSAALLAPELKVWPVQGMSFALLVPEKLMRIGRDGKPALPKELKIATITGDGEFRQQLQAFAKRSRLSLRFVVECPSFAQAKAFAMSGSLAAVVHDMDEPPDGIVRIPLGAEDGFQRELVLAWLPRRLEILPHLENARRSLLRILAAGGQ